MRALSLLQPWASLVGPLKPIETRSRAVGLRVGERCAIHASLGRTGIGAFEDALSVRGLETLDADHWLVRHVGLPADPALWLAALPRGAIVSTGVCVGIQQSYGCVPMDWAVHRKWSMLDRTRIHALGDFTAGRVLYLFDSVRPLAEPIPCKGALGMWTVPADVAARIS